MLKIGPCGANSSLEYNYGWNGVPYTPARHSIKVSGGAYPLNKRLVIILSTLFTSWVQLLFSHGRLIAGAMFDWVGAYLKRLK